ncbi:MAG: thiamine pyrophosphate-dependent enzyme, partial [Mariprofundaceae bacterium]|nr:thiamine pyrophosphate-dependent enzyme [Mariprofundaceae bacterium]
ISRRDGKPNEEALALWRDQIKQWRAVESRHVDKPLDGPIKPQTVVRMVHEKTKGNAIVSTDVGQHQMWAAQFYGFNRPHRWLTSGGLGTMGYGLPAGIGAQVAMPEEKVVIFTGDSSIQMCSQEFSMAFQYNLPVIVVILNNGYMGMVRQWQEMFYESRYSHSYFDSVPDFVKMAEAYGGTGIRVDKLKELGPALDTALGQHDQFMIIDVAVSKEENVFPMVPAGAALNEMVLS